MGYAAPIQPAELPLPRDVAPGAGWSVQMLEMAEHIGAYETLLLSDQLGGREVYVPVDPDKSPFTGLIGAEKARVLSWVYGRETITIPTARHALAAAKREPVLAAVRAGQLTVVEAAKRLGTRRDYVSKLVHRPPAELAAAGERRAERRQIEMFGDA